MSTPKSPRATTKKMSDKKNSPSSLNCHSGAARFDKSGNRTNKSKPTERTVAQIKHHCKVAANKLKKHTDPSQLPTSTQVANKLELGFGQARAVHALQTAFDICANGYHVFAVGENGLGKRTFITQYLINQGHNCQKYTHPLDWIYTYNFIEPTKPCALALKAGHARVVEQALLTIWQTLSQALADQWQQAQHNAQSAHCSVLAASLQQSADKLLTSLFTQHVDALLDQYADDTALAEPFMRYLAQVKQDMIQNAVAIACSQIANQAHSHDSRFYVGPLQRLPERYSLTIMVSPSLASTPSLTKPLVQHTPDGAPIVFEPYPKLSNLLGYIDQARHHGSDVSSHRLIQPGALHRANGGYLLIEATNLANHPEAWQALKLALQTGRLDLAHYRQSDHIGGWSLIPDPIALNVKVILLGDSELYDQYAEQDTEFNALFKVRADFHEEIRRTADNEHAMSGKMADIVNKYQLKHFDNKAQAVVLEYLSLQCEDQNKLSLHTDSLIQVLLEANRHAELAQLALVGAAQVKQALQDISYRSSYLKELYLQEITDGQQLINTSGTAVGQINALTIIDYADSEFGMPALLTAVVQHSVGSSGDILDIERDVELGGSLHAKGMLIMNSYLRALFSPYHPLNFTASLAFEQSYAHIDGDSATLAEACALLSALADIPISQALGITGSMNQLGRVQAVGGINAKVAGFFDACLHQGLTGNQGVILPHANISQLMLRDDIIAAVNAKKFHIYGVKSLSDALTILADMPVDTLNKKGRYHKSSLFGKIIKNLKKWEEQLNPPEEMEDESSSGEQKPTKPNKTQ